MNITEQELRILGVMMPMNASSPNAIEAATGLCEDCVDHYVEFARILGIAKEGTTEVTSE